ncbi:MAG TPA: hypothetical protein V6D26_22725 [Stenomitos sp.]
MAQRLKVSSKEDKKKIHALDVHSKFGDNTRGDFRSVRDQNAHQYPSFRLDFLDRIALSLLYSNLALIELI